MKWWEKIPDAAVVIDYCDKTLVKSYKNKIMVILLYGVAVKVEGFLDALKFDKLIKYLKGKKYRFRRSSKEWVKEFNDKHELEKEFEELKMFLEDNEIPYYIIGEEEEENRKKEYV